MSQFQILTREDIMIKIIKVKSSNKMDRNYVKVFWFGLIATQNLNNIHL